MLVILCAVPLIVEPLHIYKTELKMLQEIEGERLADWTFSEIKEKLLKNEIPWEELPLKEGPILSYPLEKSSLQIPGHLPKTIERSFTLKCRKEKEGLQGEIYRILDVNIYFNPRVSRRKKKKTAQGDVRGDYHFKLTVRQISAEL